jgi:hypothetical protein
MRPPDFQVAIFQLSDFSANATVEILVVAGLLSFWLLWQAVLITRTGTPWLSYC